MFARSTSCPSWANSSVPRSNVTRMGRPRQQEPRRLPVRLGPAAPADVKKPRLARGPTASSSLGGDEILGESDPLRARLLAAAGAAPAGPARTRPARVRGESDPRRPSEPERIDANARVEPLVRLLSDAAALELLSAATRTWSVAPKVQRPGGLASRRTIAEDVGRRSPTQIVAGDLVPKIHED